MAEKVFLNKKTMSDETTINPISPNPISQDTTVSEPLNTPSEPLEAPTSADIPVSLNNVNSEPENTLENQTSIPAEPVEPLKIEPEPIEVSQESIKASETGTAQIPVSEPLSSKPEVKSEPKLSEPEKIIPPVIVAVSKTSFARELLTKARNAIQFRKRKKLDKIMSLFDKKKNGSTSSPQVTNDEVEKFLHVSDATATRYLNILEKENKIKQVGKTGHAVSYSRI